MKILKIVTDSGFSIELSVDENYGASAHMVIRDTNSTNKEGLSVELTNDECCEILDFMEIIQDHLEINNFIDEHPSEIKSWDDKNPFIIEAWSPENLAPFENKPIFKKADKIEFPDPDDIQEWLSNQDNSEDKED